MAAIRVFRSPIMVWNISILAQTLTVEVVRGVPLKVLPQVRCIQGHRINITGAFVETQNENEELTAVLTLDIYFHTYNIAYYSHTYQ